MTQANTLGTPLMIMIKPSKVRYSSASIPCKMKSGWTIFQTLKALKERTANPETIPMIEVMRVPKTDKYYVIDGNRRLYMYKKLELDEIPVTVLPYQAEFFESKYKFTTKNEGMDVKINGPSSLEHVLDSVLRGQSVEEPVYNNKRHKLHTNTRPRSCKQVPDYGGGGAGSESSYSAAVTENPVSSGGFAARHDVTDAYSDNDDDNDDAPVSHRRVDDDGDDDEEGYTDSFDEDVYNKPTGGYQPSSNWRSSSAPRCRPVPMQLK